MPHCVAFECSIQAKNRKKDPKIRFHKFPDDVAIRRAWIHAVGRTLLPKDPRLCSKHFEEHCFEESYLMEVKLMGSSNSTKSLKTGAIPTLFSHKPPKGGRASSVQRAEKRERERATPGKFNMLFKYKNKSPLVLPKFFLYNFRITFIYHKCPLCL